MVFPSELLKLPHLSPQIGNMRKYSSSRANPIRVRTLPRQYTDLYWANSQSQYEKILQAHGANTRYYWLVEVIKNDCIVTQVGVYNEILPEPEGNAEGFPEGSGDISSYTPIRVTIQSFSITSTSQYFLVSAL